MITHIVHIIIPIILGAIIGSILQFITNRYGYIRCSFGIHKYKLEDDNYVCTRCHIAYSKEYIEEKHGKRK